MQTTLVHLVIIGISGSSQEYLVGLSKNSTIKVTPHPKRSIYNEAFRIADYHLNVDHRFLLLKPATFFQTEHDRPIHLIYSVKVPQNLKLRDAEWVKASEMGQYCQEDADTLKVIAEAINHG